MAGNETSARWLMPPELYDPIRQDAGALKSGVEKEAAWAFVNFLKCPEVRAIVGRHGYVLGPELNRMDSLSAEMWQSAGLTVELVSLTTVILLIVGTPLAWWQARSKVLWTEAVVTLVALHLLLIHSVLGFDLLGSISNLPEAHASWGRGPWGY
ncbi:substrate-binding domain-containing protein [Bradyrhizobium cenepequi]|uniref:substrate-binding domain-containing protein n=1 Tax=Bradyrhizobium cenepequi TaxID=2821403 RepID=UPI001CE2E0BD|nr:substrate-binding domain-containing protein [Bradyrhizobium cenepequi]MCA6112491.1 hypothetical protein [Bradyrhizobium cenepequi]